MWDLSSPIRDWTHAPLLEAWNRNHCTAREVPACPILISERDSLHCCPQSSHTNFVLSLKVIKLMPASGSLSCSFSVWNAHHLHFIELSCFINPLLTRHLLESLPWPPGFTSLFYHRFLQQVSLPTILSQYYLPTYSLSLSQKYALHEGSGKCYFGSLCLESGIKWVLDKYL